MATKKQVDAGKRVSSPATLKSGLDAESQFVLGESREEFAQLQAAYFTRFSPATPEQRFQVDNLIRNEWLLRRYHRVESHLWEYQASLCDRSSGVQLGEAFSKASTVFMRLQRRINAAEKSYRDAMAELTRLQQPPQTTEAEDETSQLASFLDSCPVDPAIAQLPPSTPEPAGWTASPPAARMNAGEASCCTEAAC